MSITKLTIGIVGLPNVGKSTLFNALTRQSVLAANYPFATIDPSVGVVAVPDKRLWNLSEFSKSKKTIPAVVEFVDIAGLVKGASKGEGLGNKFLSHIREVDAILEVVRIFEDQNIIHVNNNIDPLGDIEVINLELILVDTETVKKRAGNLEKEAKKGDKKIIAEYQAILKVLEILEKGDLARKADLSDEELAPVKLLNLLTMKKILYGLNKKAGGRNLDEEKDERYNKLLEFFKVEKADYVIIDAKIEDDLKDFEGEEKATFRKELNGGDDGIQGLIQKSYETLGLMTYFTTGEDETRAWTIKSGSAAPEAGAAIHGDFREKFIRAEVINWQDLLTCGSFGAAREKGLLRTEGKDYIVQDGDVIEFKI